MRLLALLVLAVVPTAGAFAQPTIAMDTFVNATLARDQDTYRVFADEGDVLELHVEATFDPVLDLLDPSGAVAVTDDDGGEGLRSHVRQFVVPRTGAYTFVVRSFMGASRGDYSAIVRRVGARVSQACDGTGADPEALDLGDRVILGAHRPVDGDANWADEMSQFVGLETTVTESGSIDGAGCAVVSVARDGGVYAWRVRDLSVVRGAPLSVQACGLGLPVDFGSVALGSEVVLGRHRSVDGEANWVDDMDALVGRTTSVTELIGTDVTACGIVSVSADAGTWQWRVRDALPRMGRYAVPQACGQMPPFDVGPVAVGTTVRLGEHRPVDGDANWAEDMNAYVGRVTTVTSLEEADEAGCPLVSVAADGGVFFWRVRDLAVLAQGAGLPQACGSPAPDYGSLRVGTGVRLGAHRPVDGDANWAEGMNAYVGRETTVTSLEETDEAGCPLVSVAADGGDFYWRVRDLTLAE